MKKIAFITLLIAGIGLTAFKKYDHPVAMQSVPEKKIERPIGTQITYVVDVANSTFGWHAKKVTGQHFGTVKIASGSIFRNKGMLNGGEFVMDMTSIADTDITNPDYRAKLE